MIVYYNGLYHLRRLRVGTGSCETRVSVYCRISPDSGSTCETCTTIRSAFASQYFVWPTSVERLTVQQSYEPAVVIRFSSPVTATAAGITAVRARSVTTTSTESRQPAPTGRARRAVSV